MTEQEAVDMIAAEVRRSRAKHPEWPDDPAFQLLILQEEAGEACQAMVDYLAGRCDNIDNVIKEVVQTGAMVIRFLTAK